MSSIPQTHHQSSEGVLAGMSIAHSTFYNARQLEYPWNAPYQKVFSELLSQHLEDSSLLITSPYTIWAPAFMKKEEQLKKGFANLGLHYADPPTRHTSRTLRNAAIEWQLLPGNLPKTLEALEKEFKDLVDERACTLDRLNQWAITQAEAKLKGLFDTTFDTDETGAAFEKMPDIVITCVGTIDLPPPRSEKERFQRRLMGGKKSYHKRIAVIIELKRGVDRKHLEIAYMKQTEHTLLDAQLQLRGYCSAYIRKFKRIV